MEGLHWKRKCVYFYSVPRIIKPSSSQTSSSFFSTGDCTGILGLVDCRILEALLVFNSDFFPSLLVDSRVRVTATDMIQVFPFTDGSAPLPSFLGRQYTWWTALRCCCLRMSLDTVIVHRFSSESRNSDAVWSYFEFNFAKKRFCNFYE